jgi:uncharacterized protein
MKWNIKIFRVVGIVLSAALIGSFGVVQAQDAYKAFLDAIRENRPREISTWLLRGVNPNAEDARFGPAPVAAAAQKSFEALIALLDSPEVNVNLLNANGESALMYACLHGDLKAAQVLIKKGAEVNKPQWAPLHYAAAGGHPELVKLMLENHAFIDASSPNDTTPLMMAARGKHLTVVRMLLDEGADPTPLNQAGLSAADYLQRVGEPELAKMVRERAVAFERKYRSGQPAPSDSGSVPTTSSSQPLPAGTLAPPAAAVVAPRAPPAGPVAPVVSPQDASRSRTSAPSVEPLPVGEGSARDTLPAARLPGAR